MQSNSFSNRLYKILISNRIYFIYVPLGIYWIALFIATTLPTNKVPELFNNQDKLEHFLAYAVLAVLLTFALNIQNKFKVLLKNAYLFSVLVIVVYGSIDELHQLFVPGRSCEFYDWCADFIGGIIGIYLVYLFLKKNLIVETESLSQK